METNFSFAQRGQRQIQNTEAETFPPAAVNPTGDNTWSHNSTFIRGLIFRGCELTAKTAKINPPRKIPAIRYLVKFYVNVNNHIYTLALAVFIVSVIDCDCIGWCHIKIGPPSIKQRRQIPYHCITMYKVSAIKCTLAQTSNTLITYCHRLSNLLNIHPFGSMLYKDAAGLCQATFS